MPKYNLLAIDFDGVIHDYKHPIEGRRMGEPIEGAREAIIEFKKQGFKVVIFCVWGNINGKKAIADWLIYYHVPFDEITNIKPQADFYIDDNAVRFETWEQTIQLINQNK